MSTKDVPNSRRATRGTEAAGYLQPGRVGKKALIGYVDKSAHKAVKQLSLDLDRSVEDLMREAFHDLLLKFHRDLEARLFEN